MTLQEVYDDFHVRHELQCNMRAIPYKRLPQKMTLLLITKAIADIQLKLKLWRKTTTLNIESDKEEYDMAKDVGEIKTVMINETKLMQMSNFDSDAAPGTKGMPLYYSAYYTNANRKIKFYPTPDKNYQVKIYYYVNTDLYSPSAAPQSLNVGDLYKDGLIYGDLPLPELCEEAIILYCLSKIFVDMKPLYLTELMQLKARYYNESVMPFKYRFGIWHKPMNRVILVSHNVSQKTDEGDDEEMDKPVKELRFEYSSGTVATKYSKGWDSISVTVESGQIIVTSNAEFTVYTFVDPNNDDVSYTYVSPSRIVLYPEDVDYLSVTVKVYG